MGNAMNSQVDQTPHLLRQREQFVPRGLVTAHPLVIDRAQGAELWDVDGKRYLDFVGGIGVLNIGHNHPKVVAAVQAQLQKVSHACFQVVAYKPYLNLAQRLCEMIGGQEPYKAAFFTSGAEAVENAVKIARAHTNRAAVIAFRGGFHGRTLLGTTLTGMSQPYKQNFGPFAPEVFHTPYPNAYRGVSGEMALQALDELFATQVAPERVAAIIIEPVQGDGGFLTAPKEFLQKLRALTHKHGIVLILDEIQTGCGRTGTWYAFEQYGIEPDIFVTSKGSSGIGLPSALMFYKKSLAPWPSGSHIGTFRGNQLAFVAGAKAIEVFKRDAVLDNVRLRSEQIRKRLGELQRDFALLGEIRGLGLMLGVEILSPVTGKVCEVTASRIQQRALQLGLITELGGRDDTVLRVLPPLNVSEQTINEALGVLEQVLVEQINDTEGAAQ